jgi:hypothetical protein
LENTTCKFIAIRDTTFQKNCKMNCTNYDKKKVEEREKKIKKNFGWTLKP